MMQLKSLKSMTFNQLKLRIDPRKNPHINESPDLF